VPVGVPLPETGCTEADSLVPAVLPWPTVAGATVRWVLVDWIPAPVGVMVKTVPQPPLAPQAGLVPPYVVVP
jgi:hypothetical protein